MIPRRVLVAAFVAGTTLLGAGFVAGAWESLRGEHRLPPVNQGYSQRVNALVTRGDLDEALREMRMAALLNPDDTSVLPPLANLARDRGDREAELLALRRLVRRRASDPKWRIRLATALLRTERPAEDDLREAARAARGALRLDADSAQARLLLGRIALAAEQPSEAAAWLRDALRLDASLPGARTALEQAEERASVAAAPGVAAP